MMAQLHVDGEGGEEQRPSDGADLSVSGSFRQRMEEWMERSNSAVYDRDDSTKGNTNPKSHQRSASTSSSNQNHSGVFNRYKASIIGLPKLTHSAAYKRYTSRRATAARIFPKRKAGQGRSAGVPDWEPPSPKVSCFGKVRSEKEHKDRCLLPSPERRKGSAFWTCGIGGFRCCGARGISDPPPSRPPEQKNKTESPGLAPEVVVLTAAPGLAGMKRFTSGRRSASWGGVDLQLEDDDVDRSEALKKGRIWGRRSLGSLEDVDIVRDWDDVGPSSF